MTSDHFFHSSLVTRHSSHMPNIQTLPFDIFILGLRIAFIALIYLFVFQVMRVIVRDLRQVAPAETPQPRSKYGKLVIVEPGRSRIAPGTVYTLQAVTSLGRKPSNTISRDLSLRRTTANNGRRSSMRHRKRSSGDAQKSSSGRCRKCSATG